MLKLIINRGVESGFEPSQHPKPMPRFQRPRNYRAVVAPGLIAGPPSREAGKIGWALLWLLGIPLPVLIVLYFLKGCSGG